MDLRNYMARLRAQLRPHYVKAISLSRLIRIQLRARSKDLNARLRLDPGSVLPAAWVIFLVVEIFTLISLGINYLISTPTLENSIAGTNSIGPWNMTSLINPTKMALLLETRPSNVLVPILLQYVATLPPDWMFRFMGSQGSVAFIRSIPALKRLIDAGKIETKYLPQNVTTHNGEALSVFMTDNWTYSQLLRPAEILLVFQNDAILCANSRRNVDDFSHYAWVGAPWAWLPSGGNGGLSLRNMTAMRYITSKVTRPPGEKPEDLFLCEKMIEHNVPNLCERSIGAQFAAETLYSYHPMGYHTGSSGNLLGGPVWGTPSLRRELYEWCPEVKMIVEMDVSDFVPGNCSQTW